MAIVDLLSILPYIIPLSGAFKTFRLFRLLIVLRIFKSSENLQIFHQPADTEKCFYNQKRALIIVFMLVAGYVFVTALVLFQIEPDTFDNFFDAIYWAAISLTTIGYGDIYATSTIGKAITIISALVGLMIIALPTGIITAGIFELCKEKDLQTFIAEANTAEPEAHEDNRKKTG